jgi:initiation factor 1A
MVKNTQGGSSHKSMARKQVGAGRNDKLRLSEDRFECYAIVSKLLGNGMCHVFCQDVDAVKELICFIRGKFRSRNKKSNMVMAGSLVLVGIREFESAQNKCDLLEVYDEEGQRQLRANPAVNQTRLDAATKGGGSARNAGGGAEDDVEFTNDVMFETMTTTKEEGGTMETTFTTSAGETVLFDEI